MTTETLLSKEDFSIRFKAFLIEKAGEKFDDGESIADYADETAPTYFDQQYQEDGGSPEAWAAEDMSYWGE